MLEQAGEHLMLVVEFPAAAVHRTLVQWRKADAVELAGDGKIDHVFEGIAGELAGFVRGHALRIFGRIGVAEINQRVVLARPLDLVDGFADAVGEFDVSVAHAEFEHATVADDDGLCAGGGFARGQQFGGDFRADPGNVAEHESDAG